MIVECPGCRSRYDVTGRPPGTQARCRCGELFTLPEPHRTAGILACPSCGAGVPPTSHRCEYCAAELLVKACPRCFSRMFHGSKHCRECGARVEVPAAANPDGDASLLRCPRCAEHPAMVARLVGDILMDECQACQGIWLDTAQVERLVEDRRQATAEAVLGASRTGEAAAASAPTNTRMYIKCPECDGLMNRVNFGRVSGVIVDVCRAHGTWFDFDELPRIVEFVMKGGLERGERKRIENMKEEVRRAQADARYEAARSRWRGEHLGIPLGGGAVGLFGGSVLGAIARTIVDS
jgi:Zn-finger nucleic acid-binding protein